jgi:hypothetical protein
VLGAPGVNAVLSVPPHQDALDASAQGDLGFVVVVRQPVALVELCDQGGQPRRQLVNGGEGVLAEWAVGPTPSRNIKPAAAANNALCTLVVQNLPQGMFGLIILQLRARGEGRREWPKGRAGDECERMSSVDAVLRHRKKRARSAPDRSNKKLGT